MQEAEATQRYEPPTPTIPPFPTQVPTPIVTSIPLAEFPVVPGLQENSPKTFSIVYREGNVLSAVNSDGKNARVLLDISAKQPLFLAGDKFGLEHWGSPSPDGKQLALVLTNLAEPPKKGSAPPQFDIYLYDTESGDGPEPQKLNQ